MFNLSKSKILAHRQCPKRLWLKIHRQELRAYCHLDTLALVPLWKLFGGNRSLDLTIKFLNPTVAWNISFI